MIYDSRSMTVEYQLEGDVAVITMSRPGSYNAINDELSAGLVAAFAQAGGESRALVLTGEGKALCSGADLSSLKGEYEKGGPDLGRLLDEVFHPVIQALTECAVPTVAAVNGVAAGAGLGLALGCDLRVMAQSAFLTSAFTAIGLTPEELAVFDAIPSNEKQAVHFLSAGRLIHWKGFDLGILSARRGCQVERERY